MSFEVELKYRGADHNALARCLEQMGAHAQPCVRQEDVYLGHPSRDFAQTHEAFRIRRIGAENRITYKGPRHAGPTKTREEIELALAAGPEAFAALLRLFENLGFRPVATVHKTRTPYHLEFGSRSIEVGLDVVEGLGAFAEVEVLAADSDDLAAAQNAVLQCAGALGLTEVEPCSYLRMTLDRSARPPPEPTAVVEPHVCAKRGDWLRRPDGKRVVPRNPAGQT